MNAEGLLQADMPATACRLTGTHDTIASPLSLLPGPLHAAISSAMGTARASAATSGAMGHQPVPSGKRQPAACKAGSPLCAVSERKGKGTKRRRAQSKTHDGLSSKTDTTAGPVASSAVAYAANEAVLRQQTGSAVQRHSSSNETLSAAPPASSSATAPSAVAMEEVAASEDAVPSAPCSRAHQQPAILHLRLPASQGVNDVAADSPGRTGNVAVHYRRHAILPSTQTNSCRVDAVPRCHPVDPVECMLSSHSRLDSSDPSKLQADAKRPCSGAPAEQDFDVVQPAAQQHGGGADTCADAQHQTPGRGSTYDVKASSALPVSTGPCTNERLAKDALLMLNHNPGHGSVPGEDGLLENTSGHALDDDMSCVDRPPPFPDADGAVAYEVDKVTDKRCYKAGSQVRVQYLVRWKGYRPEDDTWQSRNSLRHAPQAIQEYERTVLFD